MNRYQLGASAAVVAGMALAGCGGSSNSTLSYSAFSNAAGKACSSADTQGKAIAAGLTPAATPANAAKLGKVISIDKGALAKLKALKGPSALQSARDTFAADVTTSLQTVQAAQTAASAGNTTAYVAAIKQLAGENTQTDSDGSKLGAPSCAASS